MELISKLPLDVRTDAVQAEVQVYGLRQEVMRASVFSQRGGGCERRLLVSGGSALLMGAN